MLKIRSFNQLDDSIQNKFVRKGTIDGFKVVAIDGVETFESTNKSCANCLTRVINKTAHYFHRFVVATYVGKDPHIIIGFKMLNPKQDSSKKIRFAHDLKA